MSCLSAQFQTVEVQNPSEAYDQVAKPLQKFEEAITHDDSMQSSQHETPSKLIPALQSGTKSNSTEQAQKLNVVLPLEECHDFFRSIMPFDGQCTYVVEKFLINVENDKFDTPNFEATFRLNLDSKESVDTWLAKFMESSKCIYRVTKTTQPMLKRVTLKYTYHCQHHRKPLSQKQMSAHLLASKPNKNPLTAGVRDKKTNCPSQLILKIQIPTKKQVRLATTHPYLLSHKTLINLKFCHNHYVHSAHTAHSLSFQPVSETTKEKICSLFYKGHSAASARHAYETELMLECAESGQSLQTVLADRSINPLVQDYSRMYAKWRSQEMGSDDNGPDMFAKLEEVIKEYNECNLSSGGKAKLQMYERCDVFNDLSEPEQDTPPQKKRKVKFCKPMILAVCTPLMSRANESIQQAEEMIFCDSTSTLDRLNTSMFILSTSTPTSGIPLGVIITSDEQQATIKSGLKMLAEILPGKAFNGKGANQGPSVVMIDDSSSEKGAFREFWPNITILMCTFHFLQRRWTWLHDANNQIHNSDRVCLIQKVKDLVYAKTIQDLTDKYQKFLKSAEVTKYPRFSHHMQLLWDRRSEWAHCFRSTALIRGNHTNNYAEAGMRVLKELIFGRVKAYNLIQMFQFVTEIMERYYKSKLLSIAYTRVDRFISLRYQGLNAKQYSKDSITKLSDSTFSVPSKTERGVKYWVDMSIGQCTCPQGKDGSPCSHQAAIVLHYGSLSVNCIPVMDPTAKQKLAYIANGKEALKEFNFTVRLTNLSAINGI